MVFYYNGTFPGITGKCDAGRIGAYALFSVLSYAVCRLLSQRKISQKAEASVSTVSASRRDLDRVSLKTYPAAFTVEAAFLLGIILMTYGFLIRYSVRLYSEVTGAMILEEALEQARYAAGDSPEIKKLEEHAESMGNSGVSAEQYRLEIHKGSMRTTGRAEAGKWSLSMEADTFRAGEFLRGLEAAGKIGKELADGWSGIQTGDEPELYGGAAGTGEK